MPHASAKDLLTAEQLTTELTTLPGWAHEGETLRRSIEAATFPAAIALVVAVAEKAESADHHPDIDIRWRTVTFTVSTHSAGGLTPLDIALAREIDALAEAAPGAAPPEPAAG